jgi:hypothetical protein
MTSVALACIRGISPTLQKFTLAYTPSPTIGRMQFPQSSSIWKAKNPALVGLGSYIVNAQGACNKGGAIFWPKNYDRFLSWNRAIP